MLKTGSQKARMCVGCHGPQGISRVASYPSLAGKPADYLSQQLQAFRSGERENPMMTSIAKSIAEEDIAILSAYFSNLPAPITPEGSVNNDLPGEGVDNKPMTDKARSEAAQ